MKKYLILMVGLSLFFFVSGAPAGISFQAQFAGQQTVDGENAVAVTFSSSLDSKQNFDTFFSIFDPENIPVEGSWILSKDPHVVYFSNITADTTYQITIHKGLKDNEGAMLDAATEFTVTTRDIVPMIHFASKGFILASALTRGLPVDSLNIDRADIDFFKIKDAFLDEFCEQFGETNALFYYSSRELNKYANLVYSGRWDLAIERGTRTRVNIPITHIKELEPAGIYFAVLKGAGHYDYQYSSTWFTISDLGIHARKYKNRLQVHIQSLETAKPLEKISVQAFTQKGKKTAEETTDQNGMASIQGSTDETAYIIARSGRHTSLLPLNIPALDLSEFKHAAEPFRPVDLYVYGPRDLYRPGETLIMDGLLRDHDGRMTAKMPIKASLVRPDGRMVHEFTWKSRNLNHYHYEYPLPADAITGTWRILFNHAGSLLKNYEFKVADFLPERMNLEFEESTPAGSILSLSDDLTMHIKGDMLYGAPASGSKADAMIHLKPARELFPEQWPGFEFGDATDTFGQSFETDPVFLDDNGQAGIGVKNKWKEARSPLWLTANASLYESGGRPVVRNRSWQIWPAERLVGIRSLSKEGVVENDSTAEFDVMVADSKGNRLGAENLNVTIVREHREYYWEYVNEAWQWRHTSQFYPVDKLTLDIPENESARIQVPVQWGGYRVDIQHPDTGLVSSYRIWAGWHPEGGPDESGTAGRPDRVDILPDKPAYQPGDTAHITLTSPEGGSGYLFIESDTILKTLPVTLPKEGGTFDITIDPAWQRHDLYVSAVIVRPGESKTGNLPKRSVGLVHLALDRQSRKLGVTIDAPPKIRPGQPLKIPVTVKASTGDAMPGAWVTLAAVDTGILNLTAFKTPSAFDYFFQPRQYAVDMHDLYQRLIETKDGPWARQRFGGDAPMLSRGGDRPVTDVQIVALYQSAVQTDDQGIATFNVTLPEFNGTVRLMAVVHTDEAFGNDETDMIIAAPLVTQMAMPRFLSMGDQSRLVLDVHNLSGTAQTIDISLEATSPIRLLGPARQTLSFDSNTKQHLVFPVLAEQKTGRAHITCRINGLVIDSEEIPLVRTWFLETRPAYPGITRIWNPVLKPGESFHIESQAMTRLISDTVFVHTGLDSRPPINVSEHVQQLDAYPYGCLEQTTSGIYPHVILSSADFALLGLSTQTDAVRHDKIMSGIRSLMEKQKPSGGFGLWSAQSPEDFWLTAYVTDFLLNARQAGYNVPESVLSKAVDRLKTYVRRLGSIRSDSYYNQKYHSSAVRVYAAMVLARTQAITLGDARSLYHSVSGDLHDPLGWTQIGIALHLSGDTSLSSKAFEQALGTKRSEDLYYGDYGSPVRDAAFSYYLLSRYAPDFEGRTRFLPDLQEELSRAQWFSTQDRNALVLAGSVHLNHSGKDWQAGFTVGEQTLSLSQDRFFQHISPNGEATRAFLITNTGQTDIFGAVTMTGYPDQKPDVASQGVQIRRRYLDMNGHVMTGNELKTGQRLMVELQFKSDKRLANGLIVDLLPAGMSIEDPALSGATLFDNMVVDKQPVIKWHRQFKIQHTEYRDDRFVAAVFAEPGLNFRIFYPVRIVTPGRYLVPPPLIEDMYRPDIRGIGDAIPLMDVTNP